MNLLYLVIIGLAVITVVKDTVTELSEKQAINFQLALLLGIAYGATIGGMSTLIGTGPNGMLAGFMLDNYNLDNNNRTSKQTPRYNCNLH